MRPSETPRPPKPRRCVVLRGSREHTAAEARAITAGLAPRDVLWVSAEPEPSRRHVAPTEAKRLLGTACDVVVLDLHDGLDADVLGQCHGFVWGGGRLVLRMPLEGAPPPGDRARMVVSPFGPEDVGARFWARFERALRRSDALEAAGPIAPTSHEVRGTDEQRRVADTLREAFLHDEPSLAALLSDRGRGKSSALGLAIAGARAQRPLRVAVSADAAGSAAEIFRFALGPDSIANGRPPTDGSVRYVRPTELSREAEPFDVIVIDEAAQLPVPLLRQIVLRHPSARIAFATTARGYEGTGRGFVLRFLEWLRGEARPLTTLTLAHPIRWGDDDPLERLVFDALALDAEPWDPGPLSSEALERVEAGVIDRDALASDETLLRDFFGLLVHAHYRTTPEDLHRILDAPNVALHALRLDGRVVAATLLAHEGGLAPETCERMARGRVRIRGHALADTLVCHSGRTDAGALSMVRSVRIAVHPALRRAGLARRLVEHVHASYSPDLFGTLFGATPELLRFRRSVGYELVRIGVSRGARTGEPAAVMIRPVSSRARALLEDLRVELARDLPLCLALLDGEGELRVEPALGAALLEGLPAATEPTDAERDATVAGYLDGPRPYESAAYAITRYVEAHRSALGGLGAQERALIEARVLSRRSWSETAADAGFDSVPAAMRALRRALRALVASVTGETR